MEIPEKTFFKIGEVAKLLDVEPYVLRYWESEFDLLAPEKTKSGQRVYQREDIELLATIRDLLYSEMYTIAGARRQLERNASGSEEAEAQPQQDLFAGQVEAALSAMRAENRQLQEDLAVICASSEETRQAFETACDERDVALAQLSAAEQAIESLHCSVVQPVAAASDEALLEALGRQEIELREAHRVIDELRHQQSQSASMQDERRRSMLRAMRLEVEHLVVLSEGRA
ncbi:MAG: MerR family transcriptional regulator [Bradymonadaceae bacterium]|nr:MerR family transcriptional regulator [Lujinxingiaceae bacterium]